MLMGKKWPPHKQVRAANTAKFACEKAVDF
jgi:hypothetical protein